MHNLGKQIYNNRRVVVFFGKGVIQMGVENKFYVEGPELPRTEVQLNDNGENFSKDDKGSVPNHDKVEIIYISPKA